MEGSSVIAFSKNRKQIILVKRRDIPIWVIPGGGIEKEETPKTAAIRETKEESGFDVKIIRKVAVYSHIGSNKKNHLYEAIITGGKAKINNEAKKVDLFDLSKLPEPRHPHLDSWIADLEKKSKTVIKKKIQGFTIKQALKQIHKHPIMVIRFILTRFGIHINT